MSIRIVDGQEIVLTREQYDRLMREWELGQRFTTAPCSFEEWLLSNGYGHPEEARAELARLKGGKDG